MTTQTVVADIMNPKLLYLRDGDRLALVREQILKFGITAVPLLDDEHRPVGVVSLRDVVGGSITPTSPAQTIEATASIEDGARALAESSLHHLVVVDDKGVAVGMVSAVDFLRAMTGLAPRHPEQFERY